MSTITIERRPERKRSLPDNQSLPAYADELAAFHLTFAAELRTLVGSLPLSPEMRVVDVGCGDGFYLELLSDRLAQPGTVIGLDVSSGYLDQARSRLAERRPECSVEIVEGTLEDLPLESGLCDVAWCAQSLYTFSEPVSSLRQMAAAVRPGGFVAVLENDTLHQLLLPWPNHIELALRVAEYRALTEHSNQREKFYVGRRLPAVFAAAGLEPLGFKTQCIDRSAPLDDEMKRFLEAYFARLSRRVFPYLDGVEIRELAPIIDPDSDAYLGRQPHLTLSWLNMFAWGRRPIDQTGN